MTKEQLPANGNILYALQGTVAGIRTSGDHESIRVSIRGSRWDAIYVIDGVVVTPPITFHIDASEVECVEVRAGSHAALEFNPSIIGERYSGVILIWTRGSAARKPRGCYRNQRGGGGN